LSWSRDRRTGVRRFPVPFICKREEIDRFVLPRTSGGDTDYVAFGHPEIGAKSGVEPVERMKRLVVAQPSAERRKSCVEHGRHPVVGGSRMADGARPILKYETGPPLGEHRAGCV